MWVLALHFEGIWGNPGEMPHMKQYKNASNKLYKRIADHVCRNTHLKNNVY